MEFAPIFGPCRTSPSVCGTDQAKSRICFVRNAFFGSKRSVAGRSEWLAAADPPEKLAAVAEDERILRVEAVGREPLESALDVALEERVAEIRLGIPIADNTEIYGSIISVGI